MCNACEPKFPFGLVLITANADHVLSRTDILTALQRHRVGDWGDLCEADRAENELALKEGSRLFSVYHSAAGTKFYVITEADRSATTVLLPEDY